MVSKREREEDVEGLENNLDINYQLSDNEDNEEGYEVQEELSKDKDENRSDNVDEEDKDDKDEDEDEKEKEEEEVSVGKKRKISESQKSKKKQKMEFEKKNKKSLSSEKNDIIVDKISNKIRDLYPQLSALELSEYYLNKKNLIDTSEFPADRTLNNLSEFISIYMKDLIPSIKEYKKLRNKIKKFETKKKFNKKFNKKVEIPTRKFIVILSISAIRSCDVHRATRNLEGGSVKIIQKNPIGQDLKMLKTTWSRILNATPGRLDKIIEISKMDNEKNFDDGFSIKIDEIDSVILDNYVDPKLRSVLECEETFELLKKLKDANPELKVYLY
jgi:protein CMS1